MEIQQLEYFLAVANVNNFTRAAEKMFVTQPSVTNGIHKLEAELGVQLFDRTQKKVILTVEGQVFLRRAKKILYEVSETVSEMRDFRELTKGAIKLAVPPMIGAYLFPNIFTHFKAAFPSLDLMVFEEGSLAARNMIEREELDLGLIILPTSAHALKSIPFSVEQTVLCTSVNHPLSQEKSVLFKQLRHEQFILLKEDSCHRRTIINECLKNDFTPRIIFSSNQIQTIKGLVSGNVGISFLLHMVTRDDKKIVSIPLEPRLEFTIGLAWKKDKYLSRASQAFIDFIVDYTASPKFRKQNS